MLVVCTDGTTFPCESYEVIDAGIMLFGEEHEEENEENRYASDKEQIGYVPHTALLYVVPDGVTVGASGGGQIQRIQPTEPTQQSQQRSGQQTPQGQSTQQTSQTQPTQQAPQLQSTQQSPSPYARQTQQAPHAPPARPPRTARQSPRSFGVRRSERGAHTEQSPAQSSQSPETSEAPPRSGATRSEPSR